MYYKWTKGDIIQHDPKHTYGTSKLSPSKLVGSYFLNFTRAVLKLQIKFMGLNLVVEFLVWIYSIFQHSYAAEALATDTV